MSWVAGYPGAFRILAVHGNEVFRTGQDEDVRVHSIQVWREPLVGLASDRRKRKAPAETERTVARARVVGQLELWAEPSTSRAGGDRNRHRASSGDGVGSELLPDAANGPAAFGQ